MWPSFLNRGYITQPLNICQTKRLCSVANAKSLAEHDPNTNDIENKNWEKHNPYLSVFSPPMTASHTLEETRHGLISTSNLHLVERRLVTIAFISRALYTGFLGIVPSSRTTKDVFLLFTLVVASREDGLGDYVFKGTGAAFETVGAGICEGDGEDVGTVRADCIVSWPCLWFCFVAGWWGTRLHTEKHRGGSGGLYRCTDKYAIT